MKSSFLYMFSMSFFENFLYTYHAKDCKYDSQGNHSTLKPRNDIRFVFQNITVVRGGKMDGESV